MGLKKCSKCGKKEDEMVEVINSGIKQAIFCNKEGYITKEITEYKNKGEWLCKECYKNTKKSK
ncbi:hypothetical protein HYX00_05365 [Candidatus Woesearchaeota archaeon]|nr:hypothetical protein [Candidatus Woesearchaeota archaeon]